MDQDERRLSTLLTELRIEEATLSISGIGKEAELVVSDNFHLPEAELHALNMAGDELNKMTSFEKQSSQKHVRCTSDSVVVRDIDLICKFCLKRYQEPKLLPCLHSFCAECINKFDSYKIRCLNSPKSMSSASRPSLPSVSTIAASQKLYPNTSTTRQTVEDSHFIICPLCECGVKISNNICKNNFIERELRIAKTQPDNNRICDLCVVSEGRIAVARCFDCQKVLCELCSNSHLRQRGTHGHHLVYNKVYDADQISNVISDSMFCNTHHREKLKMYCENCELLVCRDCVLTEHRNHVCNFITDVQEKETNKIRKALASVKLGLRDMKSKKQLFVDAERQIKNESEKIRSKVNSFIDTYIQAVEVHRKKLLNQINELFQEKLQKLDKQNGVNNNKIIEVEESCDCIETILQNGDQSDVLQLKPLFVQRLTELTSKMDNYKSVEECSSQTTAGNVQFCHELKGDVIENFQMFGRIVEKTIIYPDLCVLLGDGLTTARVGCKSRVILRVGGKRGIPIKVDPNSIEVSLRCSRNTKSVVPVKVIEGSDETFHLIFCPSEQGQHSLSIAVCGAAIKDSPFKFSVKPKWRSHRGVWQCCTLCSTGGRSDVPCGCGGNMPGYLGCGHSYDGHPGAPHWSCCGKMSKESECFPRRYMSMCEIRQVTL